MTCTGVVNFLFFQYGAYVLCTTVVSEAVSVRRYICGEGLDRISPSK